MKTKIIGITLAVIMLASIFGAMVPTVSAGNGTVVSGKTATIYKGCSGVNLVAAGFDTLTAGPATFIGKSGSDVEGKTISVGNAADFDVLSSWIAGPYVLATDDTWLLSIEEPTISTKVKLASDSTDVTGKSVVSMEALNIEVTTNFGYVLGNDGDAAKVSLTVVDPDGNTITADDAGNSFTDSNVQADKITFANIQFKDEGEYTITAKTPAPGETLNTKLEITATPITVTITTEDVTIDVETDEVPESKEVIVTGTGKSKTNYYLYTSDGEFKENVKDVEEGNDGQALNYAKVLTGSDGKYRAVIKTEGLDTGSYTVYVFKTLADQQQQKNEEDKVDFRIIALSVTVDTDKTTYVVGEDVKITGTTTAGDNAIIAIDDVMVSKQVIKGDKTFEYKWTDSEQKAPGSYKIEVWIDPVTVGVGTNYPLKNVGDSTKDYPASDASTAILLGTGSLTAELSTASVALGDDFKITGVSRGADTVNVLIVAPKGSGGTKIDTGDVDPDPQDNLFIETASVSTVDRTFEKKVDVDSDSDTGSYLVAVLSPGIDGEYNGLPPGTVPSNFGDRLIDQYSLDLAAKTQEQIIAMVEDATIDAAGSDDLAFYAMIRVQSASVTLDPIVDVGIGEPLVINGTTNRKDGHMMLIEVKGPVTLAPETVKAEGGKFSATFDTNTAKEGAYNVKVDDGDGHMDEDTVNIGAAAPATPAPTATPEATAAPTAAPTPVATAAPTAAPSEGEPEETPTEEPGFEAVFAITGLLAVAYLVLRIKK